MGGAGGGPYYVVDWKGGALSYYKVYPYGHFSGGMKDD